MLDVGRSAAPAAAATLPATPTIPAARVQPVLDKVLPKCLATQITPDRVLPEARKPAIAAFVLKPGETVEDAATLLTAALDQLTAGDAAKYGCDAAAFARWREIYWPAGYALQPKPPAEPLPPLPLPKPMAPERVALFLREVRYVVTKLVKPAAVRPYLETQTAWLRGSETVDDWTAVLTAELNRLRLEDALARNIRPEQYRLWRKEAWPMPAP